MKKFICLLFAIVALFSCNNDSIEDACTNEISQADIIVNSDEFATLQNVLRADRKIIALAYKSLSKEDKRRVLSLQEKGENLRGEEKVLVAKEISDLLDIDFEARYKTLSEALHDCFKDAKVSKEDLAKAIRRRNTMTRSSSDDYYRELQYQNCLDMCEYSYVLSCGLCYSKYVETEMIPQWGGGLEYEVIYHEGYKDCMTAVYYARIECLSDCESQK